MDQRTHSWIAIRAIALLDEENKEKDLVSLLEPHAPKASIGAWLPDQTDAKRGESGSSTGNHILKMLPYEGKQADRFIVKKDDLLKYIGMYRMTAQFLQNANNLDAQWWVSPYQGKVSKPGQHLPNRIMALSTMMKDLLLLGDQQIDDLIPGEPHFAKDMAPELRTRHEAAAMYFFMLSHFVADVCMPCHCDGRKLSDYENGLHKEMEKHWSDKVGTEFEKDNLLKDGVDSEQVIEQARNIDSKFDLHFSEPVSIPDIQSGHDVWLEAIYLCRASFAVASIIAPYQTYPYDDSKTKAPFDVVLGGGKEQILASLDQAVMHDAVLNTAIIWKHIWNKVSAE
jgi:hypothetical protein